MDSDQVSVPRGNFGLGWLLLCLAFMAHFAEQVQRNFLEYYNATVLTLYGHFPFFPRLDMGFHKWLTGMILAAVVLLALTPLAYRNAQFLRPVAYLFAGIMLLNGIGHICATVLGQTVPSVNFEGTSPGFYSSPLLLAGSLYLFLRLRRSAKSISS